MGKIAVLPAALASQIAAGEVVGRPASALKELLENALDAGATRCDVEIRGGGIESLSVHDDGCGMAPDDAALCVERHATSKLHTFEELVDVPSFGFRGEALPSISSVSRLVLQTRDADHDAGTQIVVHGGSEPQVSEIGMAVGTFIEVKDLFYNVPARRKFLRSSGTESGHIAEVVDSVALACPQVTFTLRRDGRRAREWLRSGDRAARVADLFGQEPLAQCVGERGPLHVEAYLGRPERARSGAAGLKLLCNQRPIRDRALLHTITQAYGSVLERGRYPRGVVYLNLPPRLVDINVHPQKSEVRFADGRAVTDAVYHILSTSLQSAFSLPAPTRGRRATVPSTVQHGKTPEFVHPAPLRAAPSQPAAAGPPGPKPAAEDIVGAPAGDGESNPAPAQETRFTWPSPWSREPVGRVMDSVHPSRSAVPAEQGTFFTDPSPAPRVAQPPATEEDMQWRQLRFIAQVRATYLICEGAEGLYMLDQHAAAERIMFYRLRQQYAATGTASQSLLFPLTIEVEAELVELVQARAEEIRRMGFEISVLDERNITVRTIPHLLQTDSPERLVRDLLSELSRGGRGFSDAIDSALSTMACHGSIRAGDTLSREEAKALLRDLDDVDFSGYCPHGRPIVAFTPWVELERKVGRR